MICNTTAEPEVNALAEYALEQFGAVHVMFNNAGIGGFGDPWTDPIELWHRVVDVNLFGVVHGIRAFLPDHAAAGCRPHRQHRIDGRTRRGARPGAVLRHQARSRRSHREPVPRTRGPRLTGGCERAVSRFRQDRSDEQGAGVDRLSARPAHRRVLSHRRRRRGSRRATLPIRWSQRSRRASSGSSPTRRCARDRSSGCSVRRPVSTRR